MKFLLLGFSILYYSIEFTLAQKCFSETCFVDGLRGCRNRIRNNVNTGEECCMQQSAVGFSEQMTRLGRGPGCYKCDRCEAVIAKRDGKWGTWSKWSACSKTCGSGVKTRNRRCDSPEPSELGKKCEGISVQTAKCSNKPCPVDGEWSKWSGWSKCSKSCGNGQMFRSRECNNPKPAHGGRDCDGQEKISKKCVLIKNCPIDGGWGEWGPWTKCSKSCGGGVSKQQRSCDDPPPQFGGKKCTGQSRKSVSCNKNPCPIDGQWSDWSPFSACIFDDCNDLSKGGHQTRSRSCNNPAPKYGGKMCGGKMFDKAFCIENDNCARDGEWSQWGPWKCSDTGAYRVRECLYRRYEGELCPGNNKMSKPINDITFCNDCKSNCRLGDDGVLIANILYHQRELQKPTRDCDILDGGSGSGDGAKKKGSCADTDVDTEPGDVSGDGGSGKQAGDDTDVDAESGDVSGDGGSGKQAGDDTESSMEVEGSGRKI